MRSNWMVVGSGLGTMLEWKGGAFQIASDMRSFTSDDFGGPRVHKKLQTWSQNLTLEDAGYRQCTEIMFNLMCWNYLNDFCIGIAVSAICVANRKLWHMRAVEPLFLVRFGYHITRKSRSREAPKRLLNIIIHISLFCGSMLGPVLEWTGSATAFKTELDTSSSNSRRANPSNLRSAFCGKEKWLEMLEPSDA